ncbi:hypothetical protein J6590_002617 [Homalodisca vitripennis]|nr:hypothetical protein J6590_002617 [Homalodisca vitripennis]
MSDRSLPVMLGRGPACAAARRAKTATRTPEDTMTMTVVQRLSRQDVKGATRSPLPPSLPHRCSAFLARCRFTMVNCVNWTPTTSLVLHRPSRNNYRTE